MIIFKSILTTFKMSSLFEASGAVSKIGLSLKPNHQKQIYTVSTNGAQNASILCIDNMKWQRTCRACKAK
jgi:hypothetical protein